MTDRNCRNCGAPLNDNGDCLYCGTKHIRKPQTTKSKIVITADSISLVSEQEEDDDQR